MEKALLIISLSLVLVGCTGKELKKYGGNIAVSGGGNPIMAASAAVVGGTIYGVGYLIDNDDEKKKEDKENLEQKENK